MGRRKQPQAAAVESDAIQSRRPENSRSDNREQLLTIELSATLSSRSRTPRSPLKTIPIVNYSFGGLPSRGDDDRTEVGPAGRGVIGLGAKAQKKSQNSNAVVAESSAYEHLMGRFVVS